jgi:hypothetical protein
MPFWQIPRLCGHGTRFMPFWQILCRAHHNAGQFALIWASCEGIYNHSEYTIYDETNEPKSDKDILGWGKVCKRHRECAYYIKNVTPALPLEGER